MNKLYCNLCGKEINTNFTFGILTIVERKDFLLKDKDKKPAVFTQTQGKEGHICLECISELRGKMKYTI